MRIMVLPCDGIGPESMAAALAVVEAANRQFRLDLSFHEQTVGLASLDTHGTTLREEVLAVARDECDGVILGPQSHMDYPPVADGGRNISGSFRVGLDLFVNVRPARSGPFGQNVANPAALVLSAAMMLSWLGEQRSRPELVSAGAAIEAAVDAVLTTPANRTRELGGALDTDAFGDRVAAAVEDG